MAEEEKKEERKKDNNGCLWGLIVLLIVVVALGGPMAVVGEYSNNLRIDPSLSITNIDSQQNSTHNNVYNNTYQSLPAQATAAPAALPLSGAQPGECVYSGGTYPGAEKFVKYPDPSKASGYGYAFIDRNGNRTELGAPAAEVSC